MTTHMGYLPDIGRWLVWGAIGVVVIGCGWLIWLKVQATKGGKG